MRRAFMKSTATTIVRKKTLIIRKSKRDKALLGTIRKAVCYIIIRIILFLLKVFTGTE